MTEENKWKPKRASEVGSGSQSSGKVVEISVQSAECKAALEQAFDGITGVTVKNHPGGTPPSLVILEIMENPEDTYSIIRDMVKERKGLEIFLTAPTLDSTVLLEAMRAGAKEFLPQPIQKKEVVDAVGRFLERSSQQGVAREEQKKEAKILAFFGGERRRWDHKYRGKSCCSFC